MKRSVTLGWSNLWIGGMILVVSVILIWASFMGGGTSIFQSKTRFICYFTSVEGLVTGSPVWMSGIEVGNVRTMKFVDLDSLRQIEVVAAIEQSAWARMTTGAEVSLGSIGFLGDKYIEIRPNPVVGEALEEGSVVKTRKLGDPKEVFTEAKKVTQNINSIAGHLDTILARVHGGEGTLGKIATDDEMYVRLTELLSNLTVLTADLQKNQHRVVKSIEELANSVTQLTTQVGENSGTLGKLVNDPQLYDNLATSSARLDSILSEVNSANGSLGLLVSDTSLYSETANLMARLNSLISDIQENPKKYFKFSVF